MALINFVSQRYQGSACTSNDYKLQLRQQQQQQPSGPQRLAGLPIISSLLQPPLHEPGPLGQPCTALQDWPESYAGMETILKALK